MNKVYVGLAVGGLLPSLLWATGDIFQKLSNKSSPSLGVYLISVGVGVIFLGLVLFIFSSDKTFLIRGVIFGICQGLCFAGGIALLALGIVKYGAAISTLVPLAAAPRILFSVILAFLLLGEYAEVQPTQLSIGVLLLISGAVVIGNAAK